MALDYQREYRYANKLDDGVDELNRFKRDLLNRKSSLNNYYKAKELNYFNNCIDEIVREINKLDNELSRLREDIKDTAYSINTSDKEKEAARRAAMARRTAMGGSNSGGF